MFFILYIFFINVINISSDMSYTKTVKYKNVVIFLESAIQCDPG